MPLGAIDQTKSGQAWL